VTDWNPALYLAFADERTRPARDLLARVPLAEARQVYDLGCGPGNSTAILAARFPAARITGVDNSPAMLAKARTVLPDATFVEADLSRWQVPVEADLLYSNATFQWLPDHLGVMRRLAGGLGPGSVLAVQMPDNLDEPSHRLMRDVAADGPWAAKLADAAAARALLPEPRAYYDLLKPLCSSVDIWHTAYNHPLAGVEGIVSWLTATGLRPFLDPLDENERKAFLADYKARLAEAYAPATDGRVLLRFPRLFIVAQL
jgi:trans-aconitate 2-methyltransferase